MKPSHCLAAGFLAAALLLPTALLVAQKSSPWQTTVLADHPLVGKIYDVRNGRFLDEPALLQAIVPARFVMLGEKHDNPDHHRLQARLVAETLFALKLTDAQGNPPPQSRAVAFEMFTTNLQGAIDAHLAAHPKDAAGLAEVVEWSKSGWPEWKMYEAIVSMALGADATILAANLPRETTRALSEKGATALDPAFAERYRLDQPATPEIRAAMEKEIREAHCGMANDSMVEAMIQVQRARDASMADTVLRAPGAEEGALLITGNGHARIDRGVPYYLRLSQPEGAIASVAFLEVERDKNRPEDYAAGLHADALPYDFVWFTPRVDEIDPCEKFRDRLKTIQ